MGNTNIPHIRAGIMASMVAIRLVEGKKANSNRVSPTPPANIPKSMGLNMLNISVPFLALAGIKYPFI